jgi:hypothetical protein
MIMETLLLIQPKGEDVIVEEGTKRRVDVDLGWGEVG